MPYAKIHSLLIVSATGCIHSVRAQVMVETCTPTSFEYCYGSGLDTTVTFFCSQTTYPIMLRFCAGQMEACCDEIVVRDGSTELAPVLYGGNNDGLDMGLMPALISTTPDNTLTFTI